MAIALGTNESREAPRASPITHVRHPLIFLPSDSGIPEKTSLRGRAAEYAFQFSLQGIVQDSPVPLGWSGNSFQSCRPSSICRRCPHLCGPKRGLKDHLLQLIGLGGR